MYTSLVLLHYLKNLCKFQNCADALKSITSQFVRRVMGRNSSLVRAKKLESQAAMYTYTMNTVKTTSNSNSISMVLVTGAVGCQSLYSQWHNTKGDFQLLFFDVTI